MSQAYEDGQTVADNYRSLPGEILRRLRTDPEFWQGFHDRRPVSPLAKPIEDPTRPSGWLKRSHVRCQFYFRFEGCLYKVEFPADDKRVCVVSSVRDGSQTIWTRESIDYRPSWTEARKLLAKTLTPEAERGE
ncbi:MAG: hypothetical protein AAFX06_23930 [Planctomycetota bacterium]